MIDRKEVWTVGNAIKQRRRREGLMREWFAGMLAWADANSGQDADALRLWLRTVKPRPFYPVATLAQLWPGLLLALGLRDRMSEAPPANLLEQALILYTDLPVLENANGTTAFRYGASREPTRFFIVENLPYWRSRKLAQQEFDDIWFGGSE